jgi:hypothetical protein
VGGRGRDYADSHNALYEVILYVSSEFSRLSSPCSDGNMMGKKEKVIKYVPRKFHAAVVIIDEI